MSKLFVCINLMVEGVGSIVYIFNRRPIVFKKLIVFESNFLKIVPSCCSPYKTFSWCGWVLCILSKCAWLSIGFHMDILLIPLREAWTLYPSCDEVNSTTTVHLQGWLWQWIINKGWYAIKTNQVIVYKLLVLSIVTWSYNCLKMTYH